MVSTGSASNIIHKWEKRIGLPEVEEVRRFMVMVRKTGMTLRQCSDGFRISQLVTKLGVDHTSNVDSGIDHFTYFVNEIYKVCRKYEITPNTIVSWIADLIDFSLENHDHLYKNSQNIKQEIVHKEHSTVEKNVPLVSALSDYIEIKKKDLEDLDKKKEELSK